MTKLIPLFSTHIPDRAAIRVYELIKSGWINRGTKATEFEKKFLEIFGGEYAFSVNSCTSALHLAYELSKLRASKYKSKKKIHYIVTTPYTMVATNTAILQAGMVPLFADVKYDTATINPESIRRLLREDKKHEIDGIVGVDYAGCPCDWEEIWRTLMKDYERPDISVIDDAAHALGATYQDEPIGEWNDFTCYSFQTIKTITTGDGGMITINQNTLHHFPEVYKLLNELIWFGIFKGERVTDELGSRPKDIDVLGYKYAMNDIAATMGIEGLADFEDIYTKRHEIAKQYREEINHPKVTLMQEVDGHSNWMFPIHVQDRNDFAKYMRSNGVEVAVHNWRNDDFTIFGGRKNLPNTERLNNDLIHIPLHVELSQRQINKIIRIINGWR